MDGGSSEKERQDAAGGWETESSPEGIGSIPEDALQVVFRHMDEATLKSARLAAKPLYEASKLYVKKLTGSSAAVRLTTLCGFPALTRLILEKDGMRGVQQEGGRVAWSKLAGLRWLRTLRLLEACDADLEELPQLGGQLQQLTLERCIRMGDAAMHKVACLTQLTSLTLYCEKLTNDGLKPLSALSALQTLKLFDSDQLDDAVFEHLLHVPCRELYIGNCHRVRGSGVPLLVGASGLTQLSFYGCNGLDDEGVQFFSELRSLPSLQQLSLGFCNQVTDAGVEALAALTQLQHLNIGFCSNVSEMVVRFLAVALPQTHIALGRRDEGEGADCMWVWTEFGNVQDPSGSDSVDAGMPAGSPMDLGVDDALDNLTLLAAPV